VPPPGTPSAEPLGGVALAAGPAAGLVDSAAGVAGPSEAVAAASPDDDVGDDAAGEDSPAVESDPALDGSLDVELVAACAVDCSEVAEDAALLAPGEEPASSASPDPPGGG
jgi:hypothetical protein